MLHLLVANIRSRIEETWKRRRIRKKRKKGCEAGKKKTHV
jgi:hypothetical protein